MSRSSQISLPQLCNALGQLGLYVGKHHEWSADDGQYVREGLRSIIGHLQCFIPGLDPPPDSERAFQSLRTSQSTLRSGREQQALGMALKGLLFAPHDSQLWYAGASAAFELGEVELAVLMLQQTLWINPGDHAARGDLETLTLFFEGGGEEEDRS